MSLDDDLAQWEAGARSADDIAAGHGDASVGGLLTLHAEMTELGQTPTPDVHAAWAAVAATLPARTPRWARLRRAIAGGLAIGVVGVPTVAFAASSGPVHDVVHHIGNLFHDDPAAPATPMTIEARRSEATSSPAGGATTSTVQEPAPVAGDETATTVLGDGNGYDGSDHTGSGEGDGETPPPTAPPTTGGEATDGHSGDGETQDTTGVDGSHEGDPGGSGHTDETTTTTTTDPGSDPQIQDGLPADPPAPPSPG